MKAKCKVLAAVLCAVTVVGAAYAATNAGSSSDPLVTLSYLTDKFTPQMESKMETLVSEKADELAKQFSAASGTTGSSVFQVVTLSKGKTLVGEVGCEVMLRVGSATCGADSSTGLIDTTDGTTLANGKSLVKNHLYMVTVSTRSVTATADTVKVLVRGPYTIQ